MRKVLINAHTLSVGGGKYIIENFMEALLIYSIGTITYYVLLPVNITPRTFPDNVIEIKIPSFLYNKFLSGVYHHFFVQRIIKSERIDVIWNFGDVIIPYFKKQIYFFDWAYAVYDEDYIWRKMPLSEWVSRKLKINNIKTNLAKVDRVIVQTENISKRLKRKYASEDVKVIPTPIKFPPTKELAPLLTSTKVKFLYVSSYSYHKNHRTLLKVGEIIKKQQLPFEIYITIDFKDAKTFLSDILEKELDQTIINLGEISHKKVGQVLNDCDAVLFPSLLETYGIPYYEAMYFSKPLIVSDLDFARDACGDAAIYFDPLNAVSIVEAMRKMVFGVELGKNVKNNYKAKLDKIPTWEEFVDFFHQEVTSI